MAAVENAKVAIERLRQVRRFGTAALVAELRRLHPTLAQDYAERLSKDECLRMIALGLQRDAAAGAFIPLKEKRKKGSSK